MEKMEKMGKKGKKTYKWNVDKKLNFLSILKKYMTKIIYEKNAFQW